MAGNNGVTTWPCLIAVSGAHGTGKTTLIGELIDSLPGFSAVDEPYWLLAEEGQAFADRPTVEEFEMQLERSIECMLQSESNTIFDRCPLDIVAYLLTHAESGRFDIEIWLPQVRVAMQRLNLVVFLPVEDPDRIPSSACNHGDLRQRVHDELLEIILQDRWALGVPVIEVAGPLQERVRQVLTHLDRRGGRC